VRAGQVSTKPAETLSEDVGGVWLENALNEMGWSGWPFIEPSRDAIRNFGANPSYHEKAFKSQ
jgi:hypothetical protein